MITIEERKILKELKKTQYGAILDKHLKEELEVIRDIKTCKTQKELEGRIHAVRLIEKLFTIMDDKDIDTPKKINYT